MRLPGYTVADTAWEEPRSTVLSGTEEGTDRRVLIRVPKGPGRANQDADRLRRDFEIAQDLPPGIAIKPIGLERFEGGLALVLEDDGTRPLRQVLAVRSLDLGKSIDVGIGLAGLVGQLHARRIIHKNISPHSVWYDQANGHVRLTDFSIASRGSEEGRQIQVAGQIEGLLTHTAPEQTGRLIRVVDHRADHYSIGVLLYQLLTGRLPFSSSDPLELVHAHLARTPQSPREVSPAVPSMLSNIVMKLLAKGPDERYQSAYGLRADLRTFAAEWRSSVHVEEFPLGEHDSFETFQLSQKLYGRDAARASLLEVFERASEGPAELALVTGAPGAGKSILANDVQRRIVEASGYYASGKFDQYSQNLPYSGFLGAFKELFNQVLTLPDEALEEWQGRLREALGNTGKVLTDVIPTLELITGAFPPVPRLPVEEARNRFIFAFRDLARALASPGHPLVLFLDDLQWADPGSVELLRLLAADRLMRHVLVIGAYRDTEVGPDHRLSAVLRDLEAEGVRPRRIEVGPLTADQIAALIQDTLRCTSAAAESLAHLVEKKTEGNPFFVGQFVQFLHDEGLVEFDQELRRWTWELPTIEKEGITDNVLDLMTTKISRLSPEARETLKLAACLGSEFDLERMAIVTERPPETVGADLRAAWIEGLLVSRAGDDWAGRSGIEGVDNPVFHFLHDRVQQAAYALIPDTQKPETHFRVGRNLRSHLSKDLLAASPFEVVSNLNRGLDLVSEPGERRDLAHLNLLAGRKAQEGSAFEAALGYLRTGVSLLSDSSWSTDYELARDLHTAKLQCEFITGCIAEADQTFEVLQGSVTDPVDRAHIANEKIIINVSTERAEEAIDLAVAALRDLGVRVPGNPNKLQLLWEFLKTRILVGRRSPADLIDLPLMDDPRLQAAVLLLNAVTVPAYILRPDLMAFAAAKTVNMSIRHGNAEASAQAYVVHALVVGSGFGDYEAGYAFGRLAVDLSKRFDNIGFQCKASFTFAGFVNLWRRPIATSIRMHEDTYRLALDAGDVQFAVYALLHRLFQNVFKGTPLEEVKAIADRHQAFGDQSGQDWARNIPITRQFVLALQGKTLAGTMSTDDFDAEEVFEEIRLSGNNTSLSYVIWYQQQLAYLQRDFAAALEMGEAQMAQVDRTLGQVVEIDAYFYHGLTMAALLRGKDAHRRKHLGILRKCHRKLKRWAGHCPENCQDKALLLEGALAAVKDPESAFAIFDAAIDASERNGFIQNVGIGNELAGRLSLELGRRTVAQVYLRAAAEAFDAWGAPAKVASLAAEFPGFDLAPSRPPLGVAVDAHTWDGGSAGESMDLDTVLRTAQTISGESRLDRLLANFLRLVMESAGAERGSFLVTTDDRLLVAASASTDGEARGALDPIPAEESGELCLPVVQYVARTGVDLVLDDARTDARFQSDPHIMSRQPRSVLCSPVMTQGDVVGLLYLENGLTAGAFTPKRLQVLQLISSEVAVAIKNARLSENLKESSQELEIAKSKVDVLEKAKVELSKFVPVSVQKAIEENPDSPDLEKRAADVSVLFLDLAGYTRMCEIMGTDRAHDTVQRYFSSYLDEVIANRGEIAETAGDGLMILFQDPEPGVNAMNAARAALAIRKKTLDLNAAAAEDTEAVVVNIGINSGPVSLGATKFESAVGTRYTYTASGSTTNLAARVGASATDGTILMTSETARRIEGRFDVSDRGRRSLKNVAEPVWVFSLNDEKPD